MHIGWVTETRGKQYFWEGKVYIFATAKDYTRVVTCQNLCTMGLEAKDALQFINMSGSRPSEVVSILRPSLPSLDCA